MRKNLPLVVIAGAVLAACQSEALQPEIEPSRNGVTIGSGHRGSDSTTVITQSSDDVTAPADTVGRGVTLGSGH